MAVQTRFLKKVKKDNKLKYSSSPGFIGNGVIMASSPEA